MKATDVTLAANFARRAATHLRAGITLDRTLTHIGRDAGTLQPLAQRIHDRLRHGSSPAEALAEEPGEAWRVIAVAWALATISGAPAAEALERMSEALSRLETLRRRRDVLLAGPKSSMVLISALPLITILGGELFGLGVIAQLTAPIGLLLILIGGMFLGLGILWGTVLIRTVSAVDAVGGFELDLMWIALAGGSSTSHASRRVIDTVVPFHAAWVNLNEFARGGAVEQVLRLAHQTGVPVRAMMQAEADNLRDQGFAQLERAAEHLSVKILLPLGLCILPAFLTVGVIPMIMGLLAV